MIVALTGVPGTGKTETRQRLEQKGYHTVELNELIEKQGFSQDYDAERGSVVADLDKIDAYLERHFISYSEKSKKSEKNRKKGKKEKNSEKRMPKTESEKDETLFIEGHIAHLLKVVDCIIVLRCSPTVLQKRLEKRGWLREKIRENVEAEAIDVISIESAETAKKAYEIDTTALSPDDVVKHIEAILKGDGDNYVVGKVNWSEEILGWY